MDDFENADPFKLIFSNSSTTFCLDPAVSANTDRILEGIEIFIVETDSFLTNPIGITSEDYFEVCIHDDGKNIILVEGVNTTLY